MDLPRTFTIRESSARELFAVLLRFEQRRTGLAELAALHRAFSWARACGC